MYDYEKIQLLLDKNRFEITDKTELINQIINKTIDNFKKECKSNGRTIVLKSYDSSIEKGKEAYIYYLRQVKRYTKDITILFENNFGIVSRNLFTYLDQIINRTTSNHEKFYKDNMVFYSRSRDIIGSLTNIPIYILKEENKETFKKLLEEYIEAEIIEKYKRKDLDNPIIIKENFDDLKLEYILKNQNEDINYIGSNQLKQFKAFPKFIDNSVLENHTLKKSIFIEGYNGTGKTALAQQIAYYISQEYSYYQSFNDNYNNILTETKRNEISSFLNMIKEHKGILILDNINLNTDSKTIVNYYFEESKKIGVKLIFIATLEQNNDISNIKTFTEYFYSKEWNNIKNNNLYLEFSTSYDKEVQSNNILLLESFLVNYLTINNKINTLPIQRDLILETINKEFSGMLYLIKLAIDDIDFTTLENLKVKKAIEIIKENYSELIKDISNIEICNFLFLSKNNIYMRIKQDKYDYNFSIKFTDIEELIKDKKIYKVNDMSFNNNYAIFFPNTLIPNELYKIVEQKDTINHLKDVEYLDSLLNLSINNITNIIRYSLTTKQEQKNLLYLSKYLLDSNFYNLEYKNSISLYDVISLLNIYGDYDLNSEKPINLKDDPLNILYTNILQNKDSLYFHNMLKANSSESILQLIFVLKNYIQDYFHLIQKLEKFSKIKKNKLKGSKQTLLLRLKTINLHIKLLNDLLFSVYKILTHEDFENYFLSDKFYMQLTSIFELDWNYQLKQNYQSRMSKIYKRMSK